MTHLRRIMLEELQRRNYSEATTRYYIRKVEAFARHFRCSPDGLGPRHIREYQAHLFAKRKLSLLFGPILEESLFRGCLLPLLAQSAGNVAAVIITAFIFTLFHGPPNLAHWISFAPRVSLMVGSAWLRGPPRQQLSCTRAIIRLSSSWRRCDLPRRSAHRFK